MRSTSTATHSLRTFPVTSWQLFALRAPRPVSDGIIRQGFTLLPDSNHTCSHDVTAHPKASPAFRGVPHASTCALPVRNLHRALCEQNTLRRPHRASHTRPPGERIHSESIIQPTFCPSAGSATSTAGVYGPGFTRAAEHVAASCAARPEPRARCCVNPARSPKQLRPLLGPCLSSVAISVAIPRTHSCVSRRSHTMS